MRLKQETGVLNLIVKSLKCSAEELSLCLLFREWRDTRTEGLLEPPLTVLKSIDQEVGQWLWSGTNCLFLSLHLLTIHKEGGAGKETAGTVSPRPPTWSLGSAVAAVACAGEGRKRGYFGLNRKLML